MIQSRGEPYLTQETISPQRGRKVGMKNLYGDVTSVAQVFRQEDCSHSATANFANDSILFFQRVRQPLLHLLLRPLVTGGESYETAPN